MNFEVRLSILFCLLDFKDASFFFEDFQDGIRSSNMCLQPFFSIDVKVNKAFQSTNDKIKPFNIHDVPSFFFCEVWQ